MDRRVLAVLLEEGVGGAVDVEVGDHLCCTRLTAASASAAVMSDPERTLRVMRSISVFEP